MKYLRDTWYVAAFSTEISRQPMQRTLLNESVLMYRTEGGDVVAMSNLCPHRFAPLHLGELVGDSIQCAYHGLRFGKDGVCSFNPFNNKVPVGANVKIYPIAEKFGFIWIWMGKPADASQEAIPDFKHLLDPTRRAVPGMMRVEANYELVLDNLADLSHTHFLHSKFLKTESYSTGTHEVAQTGNTVYSKFWFPNGRITPMHAKWLGDPDLIVDRWTEIRWDAPGCVLLDTGSTLTGRPRSEGAQSYGSHMLTPETETSTYYFFSPSRNFKIDDAEMDEVVREFQRIGFEIEDKGMLEAQQSNMIRFLPDKTDLLKLKPVFLPTDAGAVRIRRTLAKMIEEEQARC